MMKTKDRYHDGRLALLNGVVIGLLEEDLGYDVAQKLRKFGFSQSDNPGPVDVYKGEGFEIEYNFYDDMPFDVIIREKGSEEKVRKTLSALLNDIEDV